MAFRYKWSYAEQILSELSAQYKGRDLKIDEREVLLKIDSLVTEAAKANYLDNWKRRLGGSIDNQWIVTYEWLTVTDTADYSYVASPLSRYAALEDNLGVDQIYFRNNGVNKYTTPIIIRSFKDVSSYQNTVGGYLEERISCYIKSQNVSGGFLAPYIFFDRNDINATYGQVGIRCVVADSSQIADTDPYPLPPDWENKIINECIAFYRARLSFGQDTVKDATEITLGK